MASSSGSQNVAAHAEGAKKMSLVELHESSMVPKKGRRLVKRNTDQQVNKKLADNFPSFGQVNTDCILFEHKTLRERVIADTYSNRLDGRNPTMGKTYYDNLRANYASADSASALLVVQNSSDKVGEDLIECVRSYKARPCLRQPLMTWCATNTFHCKKEACALFKIALENKPATGQEHLKLVLEIMTWAQRNQLWTAAPELMKPMLGHFDDTLNVVFLNLLHEAHR
jgi:hypothetical protein